MSRRFANRRLFLYSCAVYYVCTTRSVYTIYSACTIFRFVQFVLLMRLIGLVRLTKDGGNTLTKFAIAIDKR